MTHLIWAGTAPDDLGDAEVEASVRAAFAGPGRAGNTTTARVNTTGQPSVVVAPIAAAFARDPVQAITDVLPPALADEVRVHGGVGDLERALEYQRNVQARADAMWATPEYAFVELLKGFLLKRTGEDLSNMILTTSAPPPLPVVAAAPTGGMPAGVAPAAGAAGAFGLGSASADGVTPAPLSREIVDVAATTAVTGRATFKPAALAGMAQALTKLAQADRAKFMDAHAEQFFPNPTASALFARLTALQILLFSERQGARYFKVGEAPRFAQEATEIANEMAISLRLDRTTETYVPASFDDIRRARLMRLHQVRASRAGSLVRRY